MPMWCNSSDTPCSSPTNGIATQPHHRIVRIPPGESVVLNSAERAPYLLLIEILNGDLDFDSTKRGNKEVLKRIVTKEHEKQGTSRDLTTFSGVRARSLPVPEKDGVNIVGSEGVLGKDSEDVQDGRNPALETDVLTLQSVSTTSLIQDELEMDLVEQLYGSGQSLRGPIDLEESIVLPPPPKNKDLELAAWSRSQSPPFLSSAEEQTTSSLSGRGNTSVNDRNLSLDDYSERMRTAAVMLTQLNASLVREIVTPISGPPASGLAAPLPLDVPSSTATSPGPLGWFPASSWLGSRSDQDGPLHPSLGGKVGPSDTSSQAPTTRMRVNHSEAAAIRDRIMKEMLALEEERMARMREGETNLAESGVTGLKTAEDESIIKQELNKVDPSAVVFSESWAAKKVSVVLLLNSDNTYTHDLQSRIRHASPYGHLGKDPVVPVYFKHYSLRGQRTGIVSRSSSKLVGTCGKNRLLSTSSVNLSAYGKRKGVNAGFVSEYPVARVMYVILTFLVSES